MPGVQFVVARAPNLDDGLFEPFGLTGVTLRIADAQTDDVLNASDAVVTASGTATVQTALHGKPMVVVYKLSPATYRLGKGLASVDMYAMVNLIAGRRIVVELIQDDCTPEAIAERSGAHPDRRTVPQRDDRGARRCAAQLGGPGASDRAAEAILEMVQGFQFTVFQVPRFQVRAHLELDEPNRGTVNCEPGTAEVRSSMRRTASILVICLCLAIPGYATTVVPLSFEQLVNESQSVVLRTRSDVRAQWTDDRRFIESVVTVEILRGIKGGARETIAFTVPGGQVGRYLNVIPGAPSFARGDLAVFFLTSQGRAAAGDDGAHAGHLPRAARCRVRRDAGDAADRRRRGPDCSRRSAPQAGVARRLSRHRPRPFDWLRAVPSEIDGGGRAMTVALLSRQRSSSRSDRHRRWPISSSARS